MPSKNASERQSVLLSLFVEEIGNNAVRHGFNKGTESLEIRLVHQDGDWTMRIRDNCTPFDPSAWIKEHGDDGQTDNLGIRLIYKTAKSVDYANTLSLNVLTIGM